MEVESGRRRGSELAVSRYAACSTVAAGQQLSVPSGAQPGAEGGFGRLTPDFNTVAYRRKEDPRGIRRVCRQFGVLCRELALFTEAMVAIDGSKFKAANKRYRNFTSAKRQRLMDASKRGGRAIGQLGKPTRSTSSGPSVRGLPTARPTG